MNKRIALWQSFFLYIFAFSLYVFLFTSGLRLLTTKTFVFLAQKRTGAAAEIRFSDEDLKAVDGKILRFINSSQESFPAVVVKRDDKAVELFDAREIGHLYDVRRVFSTFFWAQKISLLPVLALFILLVTGDRNLKRIIYLYGYRAGFLFLAVIGVTLLSVLLVFDLFFTLLHQFLFAPGSWVFGSGENLPRLFPERFWLESALTLTGASVLEGMLAILLFRRLRLSLEGKARF